MNENLAHAFLRLPIDQIDPGPNARGQVGDISELATSLRAAGQLVPVIVEALPDDRFMLLDGHRRHAAAKLAGIPDLVAVVRIGLTGAARTLAQISIQTHARPFDPMAEARALHALMFPPTGSGQRALTREQIMQRPRPAPPQRVHAGHCRTCTCTLGAVPEPDAVAVERAVNGDHQPLNVVERFAATAALDAKGLSARENAQRIGVSARTIQRHRAARRFLDGGVA